MIRTDNRPNDAAKLRKHAEEIALGKAAPSPGNLKDLSLEEIQQMFHDLQVHQLELEMQNEELKRMQLELEASRDLYFNFYDLSPVGYCTISEKGLILEANLTAATLLGAPRSKLIKLPISQFILKEDMDIYYLHRKKLLESFGHQEYELRMVKPDGALFWVHLTVTATQPEDGAPLCRVIISDITERKRAEEALRKSEETHRALVAGLPDTVMRFDRDGRHLFVSDNVRKVVDIEPAQFIGKTHAELGFPEAQCLFWEESIRRVFDSGAPFETEFTVDGKSDVIIFNWRLVPERDAKGEVSSVLSISRDITNHRKAEKDYQTLFREMLDGFALHEIICDTQGLPVDYRFLAVNPAFERMTGLKVASIVGRTVREVMPQIEPLWIETYGKVALTGEPAFFENYSAELNKYFEVTAFRPAPNQFACIFADITDRQKAKEEKAMLDAHLQQAQKMEAIGLLAGGIAHDLNNILFPISGLSEMLLDNIPPDNQAHESIAQILKSAQRGSDLVKQILAFSRQSNPQKLPIKIQSVLKEVLKLSRAIIPKNVEIKSHISEDCGMVSADPTQIHQIAMNLITNASHAVEGSCGAINIELKEMVFEKDDSLKQGKYACLTISDTGTGIDQSLIDKIFEPYFTTKELGKGTGLGLSVVHGIIKEHNGEIRVCSKVGKGTAFYVYLPLLEDTTDIKTTAITRKYPTGCESILLVDDEEPIIRMGQMMLEKLGYQVSARTRSPDALTVFKANPYGFDLVISDRGMPNMTGEQLAREMISIRPDIPIIICTGFSDENDENRAREIGVKGFLKKPVATGDLAEMVRKVLDESKGTTPQ